MKAPGTPMDSSQSNVTLNVASPADIEVKVDIHFSKNAGFPNFPLHPFPTNVKHRSMLKGVCIKLTNYNTFFLLATKLNINLSLTLFLSIQTEENIGTSGSSLF